jgi:hypothetical protein
MTLMTWFVEGAAESIGVRIVMSWIVGALILLGTFNHAILSAIEPCSGCASASTSASATSSALRRVDGQLRLNA